MRIAAIDPATQGRLGRGSDGDTRRGFAAVGGESDGSACRCCGELLPWLQRGGGLICDECCHRHANEGVQRIPDQIEGGYFVGEEFKREECGTCADDPPIAEEMQAGWQRQQMRVPQQAERGNGGVDVEPGGKTYGYEQGY